MHWLARIGLIVIHFHFFLSVYLQKFKTKKMKFVRVYSDFIEELDFPIPGVESAERKFTRDIEEVQKTDIQKDSLHYLIRSQSCSFSVKINQMYKKLKDGTLHPTLKNIRDYKALVKDAKVSPYILPFSFFLLIFPTSQQLRLFHELHPTSNIEKELIFGEYVRQFYVYCSCSYNIIILVSWHWYINLQNRILGWWTIKAHVSCIHMSNLIKPCAHFPSEWVPESTPPLI